MARKLGLGGWVGREVAGEINEVDKKKLLILL